LNPQISLLLNATIYYTLPTAACIKKKQKNRSQISSNPTSYFSHSIFMQEKQLCIVQMIPYIICTDSSPLSNPKETMDGQDRITV
jgi:hypothetical protein